MVQAYILGLALPLSKYWKIFIKTKPLICHGSPLYSWKSLMFHMTLIEIPWEIRDVMVKTKEKGTSKHSILQNDQNVTNFHSSTLLWKLVRYISRHFLGTHEKRVTRELWVMGTIMPALKIPLPFKRKDQRKILIKMKRFFCFFFFSLFYYM